MVTATSTTTLPASSSTVATKIHHTKTTTITKPRLVRRKKTITKPISVKRKKKDRKAKNPHPNPPLPFKTHTHKPTTANLHKRKTITLIYCITTHYDLDPQSTILPPPNSTHTP